VQARLVKTANRAHMEARSTLVRATDGKKIAFINGTKYKSPTSSNRQAALVAEARAAAVLTSCIVSAKKSAQIDSAITYVLIHVKRVACADNRRRTVALTVKDEDILNNLRNGHQECQLLTKHFVTLAELELNVCLFPPPSSPGYSPPASPKKKQVAGSTLAQSRVKARERLR
jgi:Cu/Ag efflux protein CusF